MNEKFWNGTTFLKIFMLVVLLGCVIFNIFLGIVNGNMMSLCFALPITTVAFLFNLKSLILDYQNFRDLQSLYKRIDDLKKDSIA